ncbi:MAG: glycosyl hydrolase [Kiritimatiellaeota bacterium]|nr:glycosyl hydrolase [Kiritimatiellota bacterium]
MAGAGLCPHRGRGVAGARRVAGPRFPERTVYWWWLNGNVDKRTITRDFEAMKQVGVGGLLMFDARGYHDDKNHVPAPASKMDFMSPQWREMLKFSIEKAAELGLEVSVNLSSCAGALKGPWTVGDDAPKKLVWTAAATVDGPKKFSLDLKKPEGKRFWDVALIAVRHDAAAAVPSNQWCEVVNKLGTRPALTNLTDVVDLTSKVDKQGRLLCEIPKGHWTLLRFGCVTMEGHEFDVDILDPKAVEAHFKRMGKTIMADAGPLAGKTLTHFYSVSWEGAVPTWTLELAKEFETRRNYPLRAWLPVLAGFTVKKTEDSERFQYDYYKTLGDCFRDNFYGKMQTLCAGVGLKWHSESGGPWDRKLPSFAMADQLAYLGRNDIPQGEFWFGGAQGKGRFLNRPQAMAAHIYGKRLAASEAFTHMVQHWSAYPAVLKPLADSAFCDGVNQLVWHTFTASPKEFGKPGMEYFAGTHINPNVTWFPQAGPFFTYLGRCQFMLRQGQPINDVCVYIGDSPYQHWGRGTKWSPHATLELPKGFNYDLLTTEVLLERLSVRDGNLVLPDGVTYRMLVVDLDDETVRLPALRRIAELRGNGAAVILGKRKPQGGRGLSATTPVATRDEAIRRLADTLWAKPGDMAEVMGNRNIMPDCEGPFEYAHRRDGKTDIYFVSGTGTADCTFRVSERRPELWDPVTGTFSTAAGWKAVSGERTTVTLTLPENGSAFVVFRTFDQPRQTAATPWPAEMALTGPWKVQFDGKQVVFDELTAWDKNADDNIKFFSGTATYRKTFELTAAQAAQRVRLQLGTVKCLAQVRLNGKDLGIVWTDPWCVELSGALKEGKNELEIEVTNTWVNRLIGDAGLPENKRVTKTNVAMEPGKRTLKMFQSFAASDPLMTSGLLGPVRLELFP